MTPNEIVAQAAHEMSVTVKQLKSSRRWGQLPAARMLAAERLRAAGLGPSAIARLLGKHHTSVRYWLGL